MTGTSLSTRDLKRPKRTEPSHISSVTTAATIAAYMNLPVEYVQEELTAHGWDGGA